MRLAKIVAVVNCLSIGLCVPAGAEELAGEAAGAVEFAEFAQQDPAQPPIPVQEAVLMDLLEAMQAGMEYSMEEGQEGPTEYQANMGQTPKQPAPRGPETKPAKPKPLTPDSIDGPGGKNGWPIGSVEIGMDPDGNPIKIVINGPDGRPSLEITLRPDGTIKIWNPSAKPPTSTESLKPSTIRPPRDPNKVFSPDIVFPNGKGFVVKEDLGNGYFEMRFYITVGKVTMVVKVIVDKNGKIPPGPIEDPRNPKGPTLPPISVGGDNNKPTDIRWPYEPRVPKVPGDDK